MLLSVVSISQRVVSGNVAYGWSLLLSCRQGDMSALLSSGLVPCVMLMQTGVPACPPQVTCIDTFVQYSKTKVTLLSEKCPVTIILFVYERLKADSQVPMPFFPL
jgi:hypothetical protein